MSEAEETPAINGKRVAELILEQVALAIREANERAGTTGPGLFELHTGTGRRGPRQPPLTAMIAA